MFFLLAIITLHDIFLLFKTHTLKIIPNTFMIDYMLIFLIDFEEIQ